MSLLEGKVAVVTGAARGIGQSIALRLAEEGADLALCDVQADWVAETKEKVEALGRRAEAYGVDVSKGDQVQAGVDAIVKDFGKLDIVVNNAGTTYRNQPMLEVSEAEFDRVFAVNVKSIYLMARAAVPHMRERGGGVILNIGSTAGIRPRPGLAWYNASKAAVNLVSKSMAVELAPDRIRVNALAPVAGETPLLASFLGEDTPERRAAFKATIPLGRL